MNGTGNAGVRLLTVKKVIKNDIRLLKNGGRGILRGWAEFMKKIKPYDPGAFLKKELETLYMY
jgi:hypothetical protein